MHVSKISFCGVLLIAFSSCRSYTDKPGDFQQAALNQPAIQPLIFTEIKKTNWKLLTPVKIHLIIKKIVSPRHRLQSYDTSDFKPFARPVEEIKLDYNNLPLAKLNIDNLPSKPLTFKTILLPPPAVFKAGLPQLRKGLLFELGENQGLAARNITCLLTDRDGFLWIATDQGLYRYDGENFSMFIKGPFGHFIFSMVEDKQGNIWLGTENGGLQVLNPCKGLLSYITTKDGLSNNDIARMLLDDGQNLWVTTYGGGVDIIDVKNRWVKVVDKSAGLSDNSCVGIAKDLQNNIWVATIAGLNVINPHDEKIRYVTTLQGLKSDSLSSVVCDSKGRIWTADFTGGGLSVIDPSNGTLLHIAETKREGEGIWSLLKDGNGRVWAGTLYNDVQIIDLDNKIIRKVPTKKSDVPGTVEIVQNMIQDNLGQTWIATANGLNLLKSSAPTHKHIETDAATALYEDPQGLIWQGSASSGINIINRKTHTIEHLGKINGISNDTIQAINGANGLVYICTNDGLDTLDPLTGTITHIGRSNGLVDKAINKVIIDRGGKVWIGGQHGLDIYDPRQKTIIHEGNALYFDKDCYITDMCLDEYGDIWISTPWNGIFKIDEKKRKFEHLSNIAKSEKKVIHVLLTDKKGNIWIGSDKGVFIADVRHKTFASFTTGNGLINGNIISLLQYKNHIYAGTAKGITIITPPLNSKTAKQNWETESFGKVFGLTKLNTGNYNTDLISRDGTYWWGDKGVTQFNFSRKDTFKHATYVSQINILDQPKYFEDPSAREITEAENNLLWDSVTGPFNMPVNLRLRYDENYLRFDFTSLNLAKNDSTWYRYKLEGADKKWTLTTAPNSGNYFSLAPGKYTFKVKSKSLNGAWGKPFELSFMITPPWWQTWWAIAAMAGLASLAIFGLSRMYYINLLSLEKAEFEKKLAIERERQRISSDMHDDIGASLSAIKLYTGNLQKAGDVNAGITGVYDMINELSYKIREVIWSLNKVYDTLESLIYFIELTAGQLFENTGIRLKIIIPENIPDIKIDSEKRRDVLLIVKEAMHNIIKHAHAPAALLQFSVDNNCLTIKIKDNGTGMPLKNKANGQGLINMKKRAKNLDGDIFFETEGGTVINLKVPL
jgi:ligand-binding sensor domain-containing protein